MAQIKKKFLAPNAIDGSKLQFSNDEAFRVKSSSGQDVEVFKLDSSNLLQFLAMPRVGSDPSNGNEVTRKSYVDAQILAEAAARVQADAAEAAAREAAIASEAAAREAADDALNAAIDQEVSDRQAAISAEQSARQTADADIQSQIDALDTGNAASLAQEISDRQAGDALLQSNLDAEEAARETADSVLDGKINTEKGRIDAILLASDADKDSFAEIVQLINSVDTENDSAFGSYVLSNNAALAQEVSDRQAGDSAEQAAREAADSAEQSARQSADSALGVRIDGVQSDLSDEASARAAADSSLQAGINQEVSDLQAAISAEQSRARGAESDLQDAIDVEAAVRQSAVSGEENARMAADSGIQSELDSTQAGAGLGVDGSYTAPVGSAHLGSASSLKDADSKLDAAIVAESNARQTAVSNLEQGLADLDAAMSQGFDDAQAYTDSKVAALIDGAPALLDTLNELAAAIGDDENFASNILTAVGNEATARANADTAEAQARTAADESIQAALNQEIANRVSADAAEQSAREAADAAESAARIAELPRHAKVRKTLTSTDISNGYVDIDHVALDSACHVFIDRLACHENDDYSLSAVSGKTRVTFSDSFKNSEEGPGAGDLFRCGYMYKNGDQPAVLPPGGGGGGGAGGGAGGGTAAPAPEFFVAGRTADGSYIGSAVRSFSGPFTSPDYLIVLMWNGQETAFTSTTDNDANWMIPASMLPPVYSMTPEMVTGFRVKSIATGAVLAERTRQPDGSYA